MAKRSNQESDSILKAKETASNIPLVDLVLAEFVMTLCLDTTYILQDLGAHFRTVVGTPCPFSFLKKM